jgi:cytochrome c oxidase cbb3-type subunit 3
MRSIVSLAAGGCLLLAGIAVTVGAQGPPAPAPAAQAPAQPAPPAQGRGGGGRGRGLPTFPAQQRPPGDPALIARGRTLYELNCRACHGADLRGGDQGGPNLLRSPVVLSDQNGELIQPIVQGGRATPGMTPMPPLPLSAEDVRAVAEYLHSVIATARGQGAPPAGPPVELNVLVGNAQAGQAYFQARCSSCHSPAGDLAGIGSRIADAAQMQNTWVAGGGRGGRGGRGGGGAGAAAGTSDRREVRVTVTQPSGERFEGRLDTLDDFLVVLVEDNGQRRSFTRRGGVPRVEVRNPLQGHIDLLSVLTDKDMHDVTAYLVTLK